MTGTDNVYAVMGATGQQGGAVVDALLERGASVRAIVRDADSEKATALRDRGVEVVEGDQDDPDSLREPLAGVAALYLMTTMTGDDGTEGETRRGNAVADAAVRAGVPRVVYSSVGAAERHTGIPHFDSKRAVEEHLDSVIAAQFVRPVFFMENVAGQLPPKDDREFTLSLPLPADVPLQIVAVRDIGRVAAAALLDGDALGSQAIEIAGDELTGDQMAEKVAERWGIVARYEAAPLDGLDDDQRAMFTWFVDSDGYAADFDKTRQLDPDVLDFAGWLALM